MNINLESIKDGASNLAVDFGLDTRKAVLCVVNPLNRNALAGSETVIGKDGKASQKYKITEMVTQAEKIQSSLMKQAQSSLDSSKLGFGKGLNASKVEKTLKSHKYFLPFIVQYNPTTLSLETVAGMQEYKQNTQNDLKYADEIKRLRNDTNTYLSFQLIFDDTVLGDAFMLETGGMLSNKIFDNAVDLFKTGGNHSVQPQVDMLISALCSAPTRQMIFFWSTMCFRGELTRANARYTMFNTKGDPIRATVDLTMEQNGTIDTFNYDEKYWTDSFDAVFKDSLSTGMAGMGKKLLNNNNFISF